MADISAKMLLIILSINAMLLIGQAAILDTNPDANIFITCKDSALASYESSGCTSGDYVLNTSNSINQLPTDVTKVSGDNTGTGGLFTDIFSTIKNWFLQTTGLQYIINILAAPYVFLSLLGLPAAFTFLVSSVWYGFTLWAIVSFLRGI